MAGNGCRKMGKQRANGGVHEFYLVLTLYCFVFWRGRGGVGFMDGGNTAWCVVLLAIHSATYSCSDARVCHAYFWVVTAAVPILFLLVSTTSGMLYSPV